MEGLQELNIISISLRLFLALVCGGILGIERERKRRPAGFRTYMLVCIASALVMITSQYIYEVYETTDPTRMGAQVISGIGFLGAGTIIVTGRQQVKGLTTAAGLWASACMGLAIGIGFYEVAILGLAFIILVMALLHKLDSIVVSKSKVIDIYAEVDEIGDISTLIEYLRKNNMSVNDIQITKSKNNGDIGAVAIMNIKTEEKEDHKEIIERLSSVNGIRYVYEI